MQVEILHLIPGARAARGIAVVIDVFRAFTTACFSFAKGAESVLAVGKIETALRLKKENPDRLLMGERHGAAPPGFDFGNSPSEIERVDLTGRTLIHTTSAGTQGLVNATGADEVITGAFVNAAAIVRYLRAKDSAHVSLVCMGREALEPTDEDTLCAEFLRDSLADNPTDFAAIRERLRGAVSARSSSILSSPGRRSATSNFVFRSTGSISSCKRSASNAKSVGCTKLPPNEP